MKSDALEAEEGVESGPAAELNSASEKPRYSIYRSLPFLSLPTFIWKYHELDR